MEHIERKLDDIAARQVEYIEKQGQLHAEIAQLTADVQGFKHFADEIKTYYIDRQEHFKQHQFLSEFIKYSEEITICHWCAYQGYAVISIML